MRLFALFSQPEFTTWFHKWAAISWFVLSFPAAYFLGSLVVFVTFLSLYAIVVGHWSSWQAARVEVKQDHEMRQLQEFLGIPDETEKP